jgi:hypothetical protein
MKNVTRNIRKTVLFSRLKITKNQRIIYLLLVGLLSSAILAATLTSVFSVDDTISQISNTDENSVILFNPNYKSAFDSILPKSHRQIIELIDEVDRISEEIIYPILMNSFPSYIHGVNFTEFHQFLKFELLDGKVPEANEIQHAIISETNARRLNIVVGDIIQVHGTKIDAIFQIKITGIFKDLSSSLGDSLFANIPIVQLLAGLKPNEVSFFRVGYDSGQITRQELLDAFTAEHLLTIEYIGITQSSVIDFNIFTQTGELVYQGLINNFNNRNNQLVATSDISLPIGDYRVEVFLNGTLQEQREFFIYRPMKLEIFYQSPTTNLRELRIQIETTNQQVLPPRFGATIQNTETLDEAYIIFNQSETIQLLPSGIYRLTIFNNQNPYTQTISMNVDRILNITLDFHSSLYNNYQNEVLFDEGEIPDFDFEDPVLPPLVSKIDFRLININILQSTLPLGILNISRISDNSTVLLPSFPDDQLFIREDEYRFNLTTHKWDYSSNATVVSENMSIQLISELVMKEITIDIENFAEIPLTMEIRHSVSGFNNITMDIPETANKIKVMTPLGRVELFIFRNSEVLQNNNETTNLVNLNSRLVLITDATSNIRLIIIPQTSSNGEQSNRGRDNYANKFYLRDVDVDQDYTQSLPIALVRVVLTAQVISVVILLSVSVIGVYLTLYNENKHDIKNLEQLGFRYRLIHYLLMKEVYFFTIFCSFIGYYLGFTLIKIINVFVNPQVFGYHIYPNLSLTSAVLTVLGQLMINSIASNFAYLWDEYNTVNADNV